MQRLRKRRWIIVIAVAALLVVGLSLPPVWSRVSWHARQAYTAVKYWLKPPSEAVFLPSSGQNAAPALTPIPSPQPTLQPSPVPSLAAQASATPTTAPTATLAPTPLPPSVLLTGFLCERQFMNNCGPATLSVYLSHYDWGKNQLTTGGVLRPNNKDVNVMPYELADYVNTYTDLRALWRYGGDLQTIKALLNAGFPVMIEKSFEPYTLKTEGWMGHYNLVVGYDDERQSLTVHDTYLMSYAPWGGQIPVELWDTFIGFDFSYSQLQQDWQAFNYVLMVVYPPEKEQDVLSLLGQLSTTEDAARVAYERAVQEADTLTDVRDQYFAWFNAGTSLTALQDYPAAAAAYDRAFEIYPNIPEDRRPYRILWYETGPYEAYYYAARYQDVIDLANLTLNYMADPVLEESYYWRARASAALGDLPRALSDLRASLKYHPGYAPSQALLKELGENE